MSFTKMYTAKDILEERERDRQSGKLAHTANIHGDFYARGGCTCYTCRDVLDPTGEIDARERNKANELIPPPPPPPKLTRQYAMCLDCGGSHSCTDKCNPHGIANELGRSATGVTITVPILPPPPPATRQCAHCHPSNDLASPFVGLLSPRSVSSGSRSLEETCQELETSVRRHLKRLLKKYALLQEQILADQEQPNVKHDEMAALDTWWTEVDAKVAAVNEFLDLLDE